MSEKGYWRARPEARVIHEARVRMEEDKNYEILTRGLDFTSAILGVFGVCLGNIELICTSAAMLMLSKSLK